MSLIGVLDAFNGDDFEPYQERLEAYFTVNEIGVISDTADISEKMKADK